jgi:hypothetical protein
MSRLSGISRLEPSDRYLFEQAFSGRSPRYADSWLYVLRAARLEDGEIGYKLFVPGCLAGVGYRNRALYVVNPVGETSVEETIEFCRTAGASFSGPIIVKKANANLAAGLLDSRIFSVLNSRTHRLLAEDDVHQEMMVVMDRLFDEHGELRRTVSKLRQKYRQFARESGAMTMTRLQDRISDSAVNALWSSVSPDKSKLDAYKLMVQEVARDTQRPSRYLSRAFWDDDGDLRGVYIAAMIGRKTAGLYCSVTSKDARGLTEWMDVSFFGHLCWEGVEQLLLGGSETEGVFDYIQKLQVVPTDYAPHTLLFEPA